MDVDVDDFLRGLAQELRPRAGPSAELLWQRLRGVLPDLSQYPDIAVLAPRETAAHVLTFLDVLEGRLDVAEVEAPPEALEVARGFARHGIPISTLLRAHGLGHMIMLQLVQGEAAQLTGGSELNGAVATRLVAEAFEYADRGSHQVVAAYQEERESRLRRCPLPTDEAGRRIGATLDVAGTAQELADVGTDDFADLVTVDLFESLLPDGDPCPPTSQTGGRVLRRVAQRSVAEDGPGAPVATGSTHTYPAGSAPDRALTAGQPRLHHITPTDAHTWPEVHPGPGGGPPVARFQTALLLPLNARGNALGLAQFFRRSGARPFDEDDLALAQEITAIAAVHIDNARRYTWERETALALQRSLLPQRVVEQPAVETASRYLPSSDRAGVGGDWYDVIVLSGARVALVVGDVVGRGLGAAVTMGRLRTAVRAFADIDLMPDELLTRLDDVVIRLQREETTDEGELSATCLYAVYDPVSRRCSVASAGHVLPAVATPSTVDGSRPDARSADFLDMPIGPPLGLGGLPFETAQFEPAEGSLLVLWTDGLVRSRTRDVDDGRAVLRTVLTQAPDAPEQICDRLLAALLPGRPDDDVALLVARTLVLGPEHVATLDLPSDPAAVARARRFTTETLAAWGLEHLSFGAELIVSELVTNAIRYGKGPIQLRLIRHHRLTCEVFDAGSAAPHLRRARTFDEGGRGLLLVAQLAERWGTRPTREGKVIWAELTLPTERNR
ncbi:SpoIIE family protein phosphatase [Streptomyces sp. NPDC096012]|uniref:ATP-binding SpoIIE family protein phosphatase n=1 Tax=Streptomyces sp. NPDC096012 TaxID=3155684 RepID=UPI00336A8DBA